MSRRQTIHPAAQSPRPPRRIHQEPPGKLPEIGGCPRCGASYREGRWTWKAAPAGSYEQICPACARIEANYPAGVLHVEGGFARAHRDEIVALVRHLEERERGEHPLKRVIDVHDEADGLSVTVTDAKLAETFGRAIQHAYAGTLELPPTTSERENLVRVRWQRD